MTNFRLEPWDERGLTLERRANTAEMQAFLGGVRTEEAIVAQLGRFRQVIDSGSGEMLLIVVDDAPDPVGSVGYREKEWRGGKVFEQFPAGHPIRCNDWRFELR